MRIKRKEKADVLPMTINQGSTMKKLIRNFSGLAVIGMTVLTANVVSAQTSVQTNTTTTSQGTITEFSPDTIQVRTQSMAGPVSYSYTKTTTYVDENGNPVSIETVRSGLPVTVYYDREGDRMIARKVVVRRAESLDATSPIARDTTVTTTAGTINSFTPDTITVQSDTSSTPITYSSTRTTTYVDENGNPVSVETVRSGLPVTVYYNQEGDRLVASKVVVRRTVTTNPDGSVIEQKKTTTTTTTPAP
jgi:uncharacterized protein YbcV (DUF1398 family)